MSSPASDCAGPLTNGAFGAELRDAFAMTLGGLGPGAPQGRADPPADVVTATSHRTMQTAPAGRETVSIRRTLTEMLER